MNTTPHAAGCPHRPNEPAPSSAPRQPGAWPPGPRAGLTGWGLLLRMSRDPLQALAEWRQRHGDVVHLRIWPEHEIVLSDPALVRELLVGHHDDLVRWEHGIAVFSQIHGRSVLVSEGAAWRAQRQALQPAFAPKSVQSLLPLVAATAAQALARWPQAVACWPIEQAFTELALNVIGRLLFTDALEAEAPALARAARTLGVVANSEFYWPASWPDAMPWKRPKREAMSLLRGLVERQLGARLALPPPDRPDDLLTRLLQRHHADPQAWPLQAVRDECMTALLAGHETVAATLAWWAWCMAQHPEIQRRAAAEVDARLQGRLPTADDLEAMPLLAQTLLETLRLYPAAPLLLTRRAIRPITLGPWHFPARTLFMVAVQLLHSDPRHFDEPLAFRPERHGPGAPEIPRGAFLPFGAGPRVCLGQHLALAEMGVIAALLLQGRELSLAPGQAEPRPVVNVTLRPAQPLALGLSTRGVARVSSRPAAA
ncbi:cytochrome P450 [Rubrivivax sp. A210]|uniref:cytochrome P450 n=1 Tax=Rubrivivax sp. A210 TaxID=2772301 RepID=UPI00191B8995|nr:cytochrome P450 [Rubrivivax sp. A210]